MLVRVRVRVLALVPKEPKKQQRSGVRSCRPAFRARPGPVGFEDLNPKPKHTQKAGQGKGAVRDLYSY